jgi:hypothetical protein
MSPLSPVQRYSGTAVHWYFIARLTDPATTEMIDNYPDHEDPRSYMVRRKGCWGDVSCKGRRERESCDWVAIPGGNQ